MRGVLCLATGLGRRDRCRAQRSRTVPAHARGVVRSFRDPPCSCGPRSPNCRSRLRFPARNRWSTSGCSSQRRPPCSLPPRSDHARRRGCSLMLLSKRERLDSGARDDRVGRAPSLPAARALAPAHAQEQRRARCQRLRARVVRCASDGRLRAVAGRDQPADAHSPLSTEARSYGVRGVADVPLGKHRVEPPCPVAQCASR
jgi:hypothetical protein